ncbi:MAG TPA: response regulator [Gemmataceae bacterium]|nr:response regulator [Gemmataceae bacterium]
MFRTPSDKPLILVVDDDLSTREILRLLLIGEGFRVATSDDGAAALEQLRQDARPDLILLDLMMPILDGWQFRHEQLSDPRLADIPVIVCSAAARLSQRAEGLQALAHLEKPIEPEELISLVRRFYPHPVEKTPRT